MSDKMMQHARFEGLLQPSSQAVVKPPPLYVAEQDDAGRI